MQPPLADRRPIDHRAPRPDPGRRLRVAAREGLPRGARLPRRRERLHRGADRPPGRPARPDLRGDQGPHPGDRPVGADPPARGYWYYGRSFEGREYGASCRVPVDDPDDWTPPQPAEDSAPDQPALPGEEVLLDLNELAEGHEFFSLGGSSVSPDATLLAYSTDVVGDERYTVRIKDLAQPASCSTTRSPACSAASPGTRAASEFYYSTVDETWRPDKIWRHRLGTAQADDELVLPRARRPVLGRRRPQPHRAVPGDRGRLQDHVGVPRPRHRASRARVPVLRRAGRGRGVLPRARRARRPATSSWCCTTRAARTSSSAVAPIDPTPRDGWDPLIAHDPAVRLEDVDAFAGHLVVHQRSRGLTQLRILELDDARRRRRLPGRVRRRGLHRRLRRQPGRSSSRRSGSATPRMAVPSSVYDYDVRSRELTLLKRAPVLPSRLGRYDPDDYEEHRLWATADDGTQVPISIVVPARVARGLGGGTGPVPFLLYGYGAYEMSIDPYFSIARLSLLDRGGAFAIAHVRGGGEMGRRWYDDGKLLHKQHTFSDFIACARHLVATGWTTADRLVAEGGERRRPADGRDRQPGARSASAASSPSVPFVDPLTSMLDADPAAHRHRVRRVGQPGGGPRGLRLHRRLRAVRQRRRAATTRRSWPRPRSTTPGCSTSSRPSGWPGCGRRRRTPTYCCATEMSAGHGGVSGRYKSWHDRAFSLAWILDRMGLASETDPMLRRLCLAALVAPALVACSDGDDDGAAEDDAGRRTTPTWPTSPTRWTRPTPPPTRSSTTPSPPPSPARSATSSARPPCESAERLEATLDEMAALDPPEDAAAAHEELLTATRAELELSREFATTLAGLDQQAVEDLRPPPEQVDIEARTDVACLTLQRARRARGRRRRAVRGDVRPARRRLIGPMRP